MTQDKRTWVQAATAMLAAAMLMVVAGCGQQPAEIGAEAPPGTVKLAYVNWAEGVAVMHLLTAMLEDKGYEVETMMADVAPIFASIASGDQDVMVETWVPVTHETYWTTYAGKFEELGTWFTSARIGLVVPAYTDFNSITEINAHKESIDNQIVGIDSGAGIMQTTDTAIEEYDLDVNLLAASGPAMTASLKRAIDREEPIIVTGWAPHWKFARYDLKFLDDPKGVYGTEEEIKFIGRTGFAEEMPEVAALLASIRFSVEEIGSLMGALAEADGNEEAAVRSWMAENAELVASWK